MHKNDISRSRCQCMPLHGWLSHPLCPEEDTRHKTTDDVIPLTCCLSGTKVTSVSPRMKERKGTDHKGEQGSSLGTTTKIICTLVVSMAQMYCMFCQSSKKYVTAKKVSGTAYQLHPNLIQCIIPKNTAQMGGHSFKSHSWD